MAKICSERWKMVDKPTLGQGGQSRVFHVVDVRGELEGEFALKRVLKPVRVERFRNEIEAIKRLNHPNIIKLVDHSALDAKASGDKQFLVMPIAHGGDLSRRRAAAKCHAAVGSDEVKNASNAGSSAEAHRGNRPAAAACVGERPR